MQRLEKTPAYSADAVLALLVESLRPLGRKIDSFPPLWSESEQRIGARIDALIKDSVMREAAEKIAYVKYSGVIGDRKAEVLDALMRERKAIADLLMETGLLLPSQAQDMARKVLARNDWDESGPSARRTGQP